MFGREILERLEINHMLVLCGRFGCEALNSSNVCPRSLWTASQSAGLGSGIGSKLFLSGVNARWRTAGNPFRSPIALRIVFSSEGVKANAIEGSNKTISTILIKSWPCGRKALSSVQKRRAVRLWLSPRRAFAFSEDSCRRD